MSYKEGQYMTRMAGYPPIDVAATSPLHQEHIK